MTSDRVDRLLNETKALVKDVKRHLSKETTFGKDSPKDTEQKIAKIAFAIGVMHTDGREIYQWKDMNIIVEYLKLASKEGFVPSVTLDEVRYVMDLLRPIFNFQRR